MTTADVVDVNHPDYGYWKKLGLPASLKGLVSQLGCTRQIDFQTDSSLNFMYQTSQRFDFIFLDGDHRE